VKKLFELLRQHQTLIGFILIYFAAFTFRNAVAQRDLDKMEQTSGCRFAPFLAESAVMYSYINACADGKDIAASDPALPALQHRKTCEQMTLSLEYAGGWLLKLRRALCNTPPEGEYERSYAESRFIRYAFSAFIALAPAMIFLALRLLKLPWILAVAGALVNTFSPAALGRYTGQDLIKGAAAWPFLCAYIACYAGVLCCRSRNKWFLAGAAVCCVLSFIAWDASQIVIGLLALSAAGLNLLSNRSSRKERDFWLITFVAAALTCLLHPYYRVHGTMFSPVMLLALPLAALLNMLPEKCRRLHRAIVLAALIFASTAITLAVSQFQVNYSHFAELICAKLKFANTLPDDPEQLTFDQRYLWTPELHSADWRITRVIYPAALPLLLISALLISALWLRGAIRKKSPLKLRQARGLRCGQYLFLTAIAFILYIYFMRFRDITMLFGAIALAVTVHALQKFSAARVWRWTLTILLLGAVVLEFRTACRTTRGYPETLRATANMLKALRQYDLEGKTILSDMQSSAYIKGYTNAGILIQPKYELPEVRKLTQEYMQKYFHASLDEFAIFCSDNQVKFVLVHIPVTLTPPSVKYSCTYIANVKKLRADSAAVKLTIDQYASENFYEITLPEAAGGNAGYRFYYFVSPAQRAEAQRLCRQAKQLFELGYTKQARKLIAQAYRKAPGPGAIYNEYARICRRVPPELKLKKKFDAK